MTTSPPLSLAMLGLGTMGAAMAGTALRAGIPVTVWNRGAGRATDLLVSGARVARSVPDAVHEADVVVTMVANGEAVQSIADELGMLAAMPPGAVWAQMSTIGVQATEVVAAAVAEKRPDIVFVDAPVSGSKIPAEQGTLLIFASGPESARPKVTPVFDALGQRTLWLGPAGTGSRMKLVNNVLLAFTAEGVANAFAVAHHLGLEPNAVIDAFDGGPLVSPWESGKFTRIAHGDYTPQFALNLALKDVHLALAELGSTRLSVLKALADEWDDISAQGFGPDDLTVVTKVLSDGSPRPA